MLAARAYEGEERFRLEQIPVPEIGLGEALVKVEAAGLTHGVLSMWRRRNRIKLLPATLGHQIAGVVVQIGNDAQGYAEGDRVRVHATLCCRDCRFCRNDEETLCASASIIGSAIYGDAGMAMYERYHNGGLAEYVKVPAWTLHRLPDVVPFDVGAKVHDVAISYRAIRRTDPTQGDVLVVTGATGATGSSAVLCAPLFGISRVVAVARSRSNLDRVRALAPELVEVVALDELGEGDDVKQAIRKAAGGRPDVMVDLLPAAPEVTLAAFQSLRKGGRAVLVGGNWEELSIPYGLLRINQWELRGSTGAPRRDAEELVTLIAAGRIDVAPLLTHSFALEKVNDAVDTIDNRTGAPLLVTVKP